MDANYFDPTNLLTPNELSKRLKVRPSWVYESTRKRSRNALPFIRLGRYLRFNWLDIVEWLKGHRVGA